MKVKRLRITNFRGVKEADLSFDGHSLLVGGNNVGKSTVCEALDLVQRSVAARGFPAPTVEQQGGGLP